jgi:hypothetical protein
MMFHGAPEIPEILINIDRFFKLGHSLFQLEAVGRISEA